MLTEARIFTTTSLVLIHKLKQILNHKKKEREDHHILLCEFPHTLPTYIHVGTLLLNTQTQTLTILQDTVLISSRFRWGIE